MRRIGIPQHEITGMGDAPKTSSEFKKKAVKNGKMYRID